MWWIKTINRILKDCMHLHDVRTPHVLLDVPFDTPTPHQKYRLRGCCQHTGQLSSNQKNDAETCYLSCVVFKIFQDISTGWWILTAEKCNEAIAQLFIFDLHRATHPCCRGTGESPDVVGENIKGLVWHVVYNPCTSWSWKQGGRHSSSFSGTRLTRHRHCQREIYNQDAVLYNVILQQRVGWQ